MYLHGAKLLIRSQFFNRIEKEEKALFRMSKALSGQLQKHDYTLNDNFSYCLLE